MSVSPDIDPRFVLARPGLAEQALEGRVAAERYRPTAERRCRLAFAPITDEAGEPIAEILFGEIFDVLETREARSWGRARRDGTVGWIEADLLEDVRSLPTHRIATTDGVLPLNALIRAGDDADPDEMTDFLGIDRDLAAVAERFEGAPWRRGGRTRAGVDCVGLVQQALLACGRPGPRASDLQAGLGEALDAGGRGDLVVWVGHHAGVLADEDRLIHACPDAGAVRIDPLADIDARWRGRGAPPPAIRRV